MRTRFPLLVIFALLAFSIIFVYKSVFSYELQGDTWQYAWGYEKAYGSSLFNADSWRNLQTSLAGSYLTFAVIDDLFGLSGLAYYTISVILKFLTVTAFFIFVYKLTNNKTASFVSSLLLAVTYVGIETTHWVFNMYAYIGMIFILVGLTIALDLPKKFTLKKWIYSFILIALGIWWGPMRTTGIILVIIAWSIYKFLVFRTKDSKINMIYWLISLPLLFFVYRTFLGLYEPDYTKYYIWDVWWRIFNQNISIGKYDFLLSPASNIARTLLPDIWFAGLPVYQTFSPYFGLTNFRAVLIPTFLIFIGLSFIITRVTKYGIPLFQRMFILGFLWTALVTFIYKLGPPNFPSWQDLMFTLWGGYFLVVNVAFFTFAKKDSLLRDIFFFSFFFSFAFVLTPLIQNGGNTFGTLHRYFVVTAAAFPLFLAGLLAEASHKKFSIPKAAIFVGVYALIILHATFTKRFFDFKAQAHNRVISNKIWNQFVNVVPNKPEYKNKNPVIWFEAANNKLDKEILFESLFFGLVFRIGLNYDWNPSAMSGFYYENYDTLVTEVSKNPKVLNDFYAVRVENGNLLDISDEIKKDLQRKTQAS